MTKKEEKTKILYVVGAGRSGSTLLSNILGQLDGFTNVGELYYLWEIGLLGDKKCGCGQLVRACPLWSSLLEDVFGRVSDRDAQAMYAFTQQVARTRHLPQLLTKRGRQSLSQTASYYLHKLRDMYKAIQQATNARVIIDTSKFPSYALILQQIAGLDVYVLHLTRDPRAVAFSWQRKKLDPATGRLFSRMGVLKSGLIWTTWNLGAEWLPDFKPAGRYLRLRYEDFVVNPRESVAQLVAFLDEEVKDLPFTGERTVDLTFNHSIAGNPVRFNQGEVKLRLDAEWARRMGEKAKLFTLIMTWPLLKRYGYPLLDRSP